MSEELKKERKPWMPSPKWLEAQEKLKYDRIHNPQKFIPKPKNKKRKGSLVPGLSRADFNDATIAKTQKLIKTAFEKLEGMLNSDTMKTNPVGMSLVIKNLSDINNATQGSGALSRANESKSVMEMDGKSLNREGLIAFNSSANITDLANLERFTEPKEESK